MEQYLRKVNMFLLTKKEMLHKLAMIY